jgi:DNA-binding MarR family transcriptional regulator
VSSAEFPAPNTRLGYLLKHALARLEELHAAVLGPLGLTGRELGVLLTVAEGEPPSQQEAALRIGIDRTTMVAFLDALEGKGLLVRHPSAEDRRRNVVELTEAGRDTLRAAVRATDTAQAEFLATLDEVDARRFRDSLRLLVVDQPQE